MAFLGLSFITCALIGMAAHVLIPDLDNVNNAFAAIVKVSLPDLRQ